MRTGDTLSIHYPARLKLVFSAVRFLAGKALSIFATIFVGVFITILIVNYPVGRGSEVVQSPFAQRIENQIEVLIRHSYYDGTFPYDPNAGPIETQEENFRQTLRDEAGLNLPFLPRNLFWTYKALLFNWGDLDTLYAPVSAFGGTISELLENDVLKNFPNTLLLVGTAYLLVFLIGMPLALYLARHHGGWLDRLVTILSPVSSVPSWVFGILLVTVFAVQLRLLPASGMYDPFEQLANGKTLTELLRHMLLPVSALVLSLLFQLIYAWRTFFIIYSEEDYVELARAKGLSNRVLERQYILRPALPFIITSFTTSLINFWQLTVALEKIFSWPGIGSLYISALPNYFKEGVEIGDLMIVIQIVVIFAYLLGILVFLLDLVYVIVDPRIHLAPTSTPTEKSVRFKTRGSRSAGLEGRQTLDGLNQAERPQKKRAALFPIRWNSLYESLKDMGWRGKMFLQELRRYPSAIFGLMVILILLTGSLYAVTALPYKEYGKAFDERRMTGQSLMPRVAMPAWTNYFRATPLLSTLVVDEESSGAVVSTKALDNGIMEKIVILHFDYNYGELPSDVFLYLDPLYIEKFPFVSLTWVTPDGTQINLKSIGARADTSYDFTNGIPVDKLLDRNPSWRDWFVRFGQSPTTAYSLLFAKPGATESSLQTGDYQLIVTSLFFEEQSDLHPKLVLLGQVYGLAGTDYWRRDLMIPLFWGMPFALFVGLLGALITTLIAIVLPAVGVWYGGWLDNIIQRMTEVNMVLPGLAIAVLANLLYGTDIWIVLGIVVLLNAFGAPVKSFRAAFLQAKEAPYIEAARSYGAKDFRIITRYLVPRILPVFIPQLVTQIPGFIFLEATLGFFNINSSYPSWGRIIYDGLARGSLYGSAFWVLEPIFLLLLTGLAFAMFGSALERILNPRVIDSVALSTSKK